MNISGTKKRILDVSLDLFSTYGYSAVSVEQIAAKVGIKAPSLYKHFKGKQEIFDTIFQVMNENYKEQTEKLSVHIQSYNKDIALFTKVTEEELFEKVKGIVMLSLKDEYISKFRRLVTTHQYSDSKIGKLYTERYVEMIYSYHEKLFKELIKAGVLIDGDVKIMAIQYVAPVYDIIGICDREPEREAEMLDILKRHIHQFNLVYRNNNN